MSREFAVLDANEAVASVAYRASEVIAIYPITPASPMAEHCDEWAAKGRPNLFGLAPELVQMQSEAGAAGTLHGALQGGALATTFTASQGLLLMIPDMYKIAGELNAMCLHVAARTVATHALSIFGDHSDVMAARATGFALLASGSVQEAQDLALIAHAAALESRIPFLHFFDGFRTSHEIAKISPLSDEDLRVMLSEEAIRAHRRRGLTPDRPVLRGTAQNPDVFFQARESCNPFYAACPALVQRAMDRFAALTGRRYQLFDYAGHPQAERVIVMMGSGAETAHETADWLNARGERTGVLRVRLFRPFSAESFLSVLPSSVRSLAVLDRTKEPGALGEPLYLDVLAALAQANGTRKPIRVIGGRYGLSSKEFTPGMAKAVFDELSKDHPKRAFTVGIEDDVTRLSLSCEAELDIEPPQRRRAVFFGLGSDGTVGANKNSIKMIGRETRHAVQGYFVYDSKKAGTETVSHLRFGPGPIRSEYLISRADFVACHHFGFLDRLDVLGCAAPGATLLLNAPDPVEDVWGRLPREAQEQIIAKDLKVYAIDARCVAREAGLGRRINTVMQTCFFALTDILPAKSAAEKIKEAVRSSYAKQGEEVLRRNFAAVDQALTRLRRVAIPSRASSPRRRPGAVPAEAPAFVRNVTAAMMEGRGDQLPVSAFLPDGTWPTGTSRWEKRGIAESLPVWDQELCIQCNKCAFVCPHAALRPKVFASQAAAAPAGFKTAAFRSLDQPALLYALQVAPEDCTGCSLCVEACPAKDKADPGRRALHMEPQAPHLDQEKKNWEFFREIPEADRARVKRDIKGTQFLQPLFEFCGACAGCGETPYIKLLTQLFGDHLLIANATGCSSIYGGNLPTTPYAAGRDGRGPAWSNSLFEDNAEFGLGLRLAADSQARQAAFLLETLQPRLGTEFTGALLGADQSTESGLESQRERVRALKSRLAKIPDQAARRLELLADALVVKSIWLVGGDGWSYDIGFGGLDHVLASGRNVKALVLDTAVYSNTGGQQSKATPFGARAKFAMGGKATNKKDLGQIAMSYGSIYTASVAFGARDSQTVSAFLEAESYPGPALIIAYSPCVVHGYDLAQGLRQQKLAVDSGVWPLYRFDPRRKAQGLSSLQLDSGAPKIPAADYLRGEPRFLNGGGSDSDAFRSLAAATQEEAARRYAALRRMEAA